MGKRGIRARGPDILASPYPRPGHEPGAAIRASDWLYRSALLLRDLSARSWQWYAVLS